MANTSFETEFSLEYDRFLLTKLSLHQITHKKIVQKIHKSYIQSQTIIVEIKNRQFKKEIDENHLKSFQYSPCEIILSLDYSLEEKRAISKGMIQLNNEVFPNPQIKHLNLTFSECTVNSKIVRHLSQGLKQLKNLQSFRLQIWDSEIDPQDFLEILTRKNFPHLKELKIYLDSDFIQDDDEFFNLIITLGQKFPGLQNLKYDLFFKLDEDQSLKFSNVLKTLQNLEKFAMKNIKFTTIKAFQNFFGNLQKIKSLEKFKHIISRPLNEEEGKIVGQFITSSKNLKNVILDYENGLDMEVFFGMEEKPSKELFRQCAQWDHVSKFSFSIETPTPYSNEEFEELVESIGRLQNLENLSLKINNIFESCEQLMKIGLEIFKLKKLESLYIAIPVGGKKISLKSVEIFVLLLKNLEQLKKVEIYLTERRGAIHKWEEKLEFLNNINFQLVLQ